MRSLIDSSLPASFFGPNMHADEPHQARLCEGALATAAIQGRSPSQPLIVEYDCSNAHQRPAFLNSASSMLAPANRSGSVAVNYKTLLCLVLMLCAPRLLTAQAILHAFNWTYAEVAAKAPEIKALGYASVLVSPPLKSEGSAWWARYQPQDYRLIDSPLGNTEDFRAMAAQLSSNGLQLYADIVVNHMANEAGQRPDLNYPGQRVLDRYASNSAYYERQRLFGDLRENLLTAAIFTKRAASVTTTMYFRCKTGVCVAARVMPACLTSTTTIAWSLNNVLTCKHSKTSASAVFASTPPNICRPNNWRASSRRTFALAFLCLAK